MEIMKETPGTKYRKSNLKGFRERDIEFIDELCQKYRGLQTKDLEPMNPGYSCVICKNYLICLGDVSSSCPDSDPATEEEFAAQYDFEV
jgi:hypothetical protein